MITFTTYIIMYITCKNISKKTSIGIIGALLYTFSLYRIVDVYREKQIKVGYEKEILSYKNELVNAIQKDMIENELDEIKKK